MALLQRREPGPTEVPLGDFWNSVDGRAMSGVQWVIGNWAIVIWLSRFALFYIGPVPLLYTCRASSARPRTSC
jgi:hypothetical protein